MTVITRNYENNKGTIILRHDRGEVVKTSVRYTMLCILSIVSFFEKYRWLTM